MSRGLSSQVRAVSIACLLLAAGAVRPAAAQIAMDEGFTYQGRLSQDGVLATGVFDIQFQLFDDPAAGNLVKTFDAADVSVTSGLFQTKVRFGKEILTSSKRFMQVLVRPGASVGAFTPLGDRQELNAVPFAVTTLSIPSMQTVFEASQAPTIATTGAPFSLNPPTGADLAFHVVKGFSFFGLSQAAPAAIQMRNANSTSNFTSLLGAFNSGAGLGDGLALWDAAGHDALSAARAYVFAGPGPQSTGGRILLSRDTGGNAGIELTGNHASGNPKLTLAGASGHSVVFDLTASAPNRVQLPVDAVQAAEISDEPGVSGTTLPGTASASTSLATIRSVSITAPDSGFVIVFMNARAGIAHVNGTGSSLTYGLATSASLTGAQQIVASVPNTAPTGTYGFPMGGHAIFPVSAGLNTFQLAALRAGAGSASIGQITMSCLYVPTSYGSFTRLQDSGNHAMQIGPLSPAEFQSERLLTSEANATRMERELADMRRRFEALEAELRQRPAPILSAGHNNPSPTDASQVSAAPRHHAEKETK